MPDRAEVLAERRARLDPDHQERIWRSRRVGHAVATGALGVLMLLALLDGVDAVDSFGVDDDRVDASVGGTALQVRYPTVTRPALASPFEIVVTRQGGFDGQQIEVTVSTAYLSLWDLNGVFPSPAEETADGDRVHWTFDPPDGETLRIVYEARIEPAAQDGEPGRVAVLDADGAELVAVEFETRIRP
jgi:hypothetical protein